VTVNNAPIPAPFGGDKLYITVKVSPPRLVPDMKERYFLEYNDEWASDDNLKLRVDAEGLLQTSEGKAKDRSGDAAIKVVELAGEAAKLAIGSPLKSFRFNSSPISTPAACTLGEFSAEILADPTQASALAGVSLPSHPLTLTFTRIPASNSPTTLPDPAKPGSADHKGVVFRSLTAYSLKVEVTANSGCQLPPSTSELLLTVPSTDVADNFSVDTSRAALVEKRVNLVVVNGMLVGIDVDKPSQLLAALSLPVDFLKAVVSIPGELLTFKVNQVKGEAALTSEQASALAAQLELLKNKKALEEENSTP
jgi:hypothetical protein